MSTNGSLFKSSFIICILACLTVAAIGTAHATDKNASRCYEAETAYNSGQPGYYLSLAVAADRTIHVVHWDAGSHAILHTKRAAGIWSTVPFTSSLPIVDLSVALNPNNLPTVTYVNGTTGEVVWLDPALGEASAEIINPLGPSAARVAMATDNFGKIKVIFHATDDGGIWFAERIAGIWSAPLRLSDAEDLGGLALKSNGDPWVVLANGLNLIALHRTGGVWTSENVQTNQAGLGTEPAITISSAGQPNVAWEITGSSPVVYRSFPGGSPWNQEIVTTSTDGIAVGLNIAEEPWRNEINVTFLRPVIANFSLYNRFSPTVWDSRSWGTSSDPVHEATTAPHPDTGLVIATRRGGRVEVRHQEVVPVITGSFSPNPAYGGETIVYNASVQCTDTIEFDGVFVVGGTISGVQNNFLATVSGQHILTALNGYATTDLVLDLVVLPISAISLQHVPEVSPFGDPVTLTWFANGADLITIEPGGFTSDQQSGTHVVYPTADTTYELIAENFGYGADTTSTFVDTELLANFQLSVTDGLIIYGDTTNLQWSATGADSISIEPGGFTPMGQSGQIPVSPTTTTTYTMTAFNDGFGQQSLQVTIVVEPLRITSFTADPADFLNGEEVTLSWQIKGIANVDLQGVGGQPLTGSLLINPSQSVDYILTAAWEGFVRRDTVTVSPTRFIRIETSFSADEIDRDPSHLIPGVPFDVFLFWTGPPRTMQGLEFGLEFSVGGVFAISSVEFFNSAANLGTNTEWKIYGTCFTPEVNTMFAKVTLVIADANAAANGQLLVRGISGGVFPDQPGFIKCTGVNQVIVGGPPLSLDANVSGATSNLPKATRITRIHPNPFNPRTTIDFELRAVGSPKLEIYDLAGRLVSTIQIPLGATSAQWDGTDKGGRAASSGVYFFRLQEAGTSHVKRAVLVR